MIFLVYRCSPASTVICINEEFSKYAWTTRAQLELLDLNELTRTTLKSAGFLGPATDSTQIHSAIDAFIHAYNTGDLESLLSLYAQDLVKLSQGSAPESKADTAARLLAFFAANTGALVVHNDEVMISGDFAFTRGTLKITVVPRSSKGEPQVIGRRFLKVWRKDSGRWKVTRTMDSEL